MRKIFVKSLSLVNFKGVRELDLQFVDGENMIGGSNGTGKTTVFDAFTWLMFGKDSTGRSDSNFNIKTLDDAGKPIYHLDHSVVAVMCVDGTDVKLERKYVEVWQKQSGTTDMFLKNHKTEFFVNDVKCATKKEYDAEVNEIINESVYKMITNPWYFPQLSADNQKSMLIDMAGEVSDEDVAATNKNFAKFLEDLNGKPMEKMAKEIQAKKRACNEILDRIPSQIETAENVMPEAEDWDAIDAEIKNKLKEIEDIDATIADKSKVNEQEYERKASIQNQIGDAKLELANVKNEIRANASQARNVAIQEINNIQLQIQGNDNMIKSTNRLIENQEKEIESKEINVKALREEYKKVFASMIEFDDGQFICPTCKRPYDAADIEAKKKELTENFNTDKADKLKKIQEKGKALNAALEEMKQTLATYKKELAKHEESVLTLQKKKSEKEAEMPEPVDEANIIDTDQRVIDLQNKIVDLENQLNVGIKVIDVSELREQKRVANEALQGLYKRAAKKEQIERTRKEIEDLEKKQASNNQVLADCEQWERLHIQFQKAKDEELLKRINGMFEIVSFSFLSTQLNGNEKLTCVCTVNGTPYPDVNNAGKINAGLDIINAICKAKGVTAPIFVDNAESVNDILKTYSQKIMLYVTKDSTIRKI